MGTCDTRPAVQCERHPGLPSLPRQSAPRDLYLTAALAEIPRLLGAIDRNPYRPTYGCLDRQYWHYRTASFPSEMYQEGVLPLALVFATPLPGNQWHGDARVRELAIAATRFVARSCHPDGSCDDYYPRERALGAAVFSLQAAARAYQVLDLHDPELLAWFQRRAGWLVRHDETGHLANHQALAALGLMRVAQITRQPAYADAARDRLRTVLAWQHAEGWFEEYGGADPGYQTVTIDCLAKIRRMGCQVELDEPLRRALAFARCFLHPDGSYGGEYGSRGTYHFYPHGMELLAAENADAADLADGFLRGLASGTQAFFSDDRLFAHRLANLIEAYLDWSPRKRFQEPFPAQETVPGTFSCFAGAGLLVRRGQGVHTVVSAARGGVFKHFAGTGHVVTDAGLIVEVGDGRVAVSQSHDLGRTMELHGLDEPAAAVPPSLLVGGALDWVRFETATPVKQALFHTGMVLVGRWCRGLVRRWLQRRLITGRRPCPIRLTRRFDFLPEPPSPAGPTLLVTDTIELTDPGITVRRMSFGTDHQTAYVAASGVYQRSALAPWTDLADHVEALNRRRRVTIVRQW